MVEKFFNTIDTNKIVMLLVVFCQSSFLASSQSLEYSNSIINKNKVKIEYVVSNFDKNDNVFVNIVKHKQILPEKTAIVLIDVWNNDFLNPMVTNFLNPLIEDFSQLGFYIIYSPSQEKQHKYLLKVAKGITFHYGDTMDDFVFENGIENLIYVGFDALYCVIDKPNGLYSFKQRNKSKNIDYFVFEKGITSYGKGMKEVAISLFKKNNIGVIYTDNIKLNSVYPSGDNKYLRSKTSKTLNKGKNLVLIFENGQINDSILNFKEKLDQSKVDYLTVIEDKLYTKNSILESDDRFIDFLIKHKIDNIYYAGYHLNNEILWSKYGITNLYIHKRYIGIKSLPKVFIINDKVYIAKSKDIDSKFEKVMILNHYRGIPNIFSNTLF